MSLFMFADYSKHLLVAEVKDNNCLAANVCFKDELSHIMKNPAFCICKNKGDQLGGKCAVDQ